MNRIENKLSIILTTYNRAELLKKTFEYLKDSPIKDCRITILNNKSSDNTLEICDEYAHNFSNFRVVTHPVNLGGGCENYIHAIEYCDTEYMWILADDDEYDFSKFEDVSEAICSGNYDLIQVGAHNDSEWNWGVADTPRNLDQKGYNYFRYSSFLPCSIFRFDFFTQYMKEAYAAINIRYPHMPCLISAYNDDKLIYLSANRIVTAVIGNQAYSGFVSFRGFVMLSKYLHKRSEKKAIVYKAYTTRFFNLYIFLRYIYYFIDFRSFERMYVFCIAFSLLNIAEKILCIFLLPPVIIYRIIRCK